MNVRPDEREMRLVWALADALADFHREKRGNIACYLQAVGILTESGPLQKYQQVCSMDFLRTEHYPPRRQKRESTP